MALIENNEDIKFKEMLIEHLSHFDGNIDKIKSLLQLHHSTITGKINYFVLLIHYIYQNEQISQKLKQLKSLYWDPIHSQEESNEAWQGLESSFKAIESLFVNKTSVNVDDILQLNNAITAFLDSSQESAEHEGMEQQFQDIKAVLTSLAQNCET